MVTGALGIGRTTAFCLRACGKQDLARPLVSPDKRTAGITYGSRRPDHPNEDGFVALRTAGDTLLAVCDGVGSLPHADVASTVALKSLEYQFRGPGFSLEPAAKEANQAILDKSRHPSMLPKPDTILIWWENKDGTIEESEYPAPPDHPAFYEDESIEMGSTLIAAQIRGNRAKVLCSGDSKAFLIDRRNKLFIMNEDHNRSALQYQLYGRSRFPLYDPRFHEPRSYYEWQRNYPLRNPINASLGNRPEDFIFNTASRRLRHGDRMLLASDGLSNYLPYATLVQILLKFAPVEETVSELFDKTQRQIKESGHFGDDVTILLHEHSAIQ